MVNPGDVRLWNSGREEDPRILGGEVHEASRSATRWQMRPCVDLKVKN